MTFQPGAVINTVSFGLRAENVEVPFLATTPPNSSAVNFPLGKRWVDTVGQNTYTLVGLSSVGGVLTATWDAGGIEHAQLAGTVTPVPEANFGSVSLSTLTQLQAGSAPSGAVVPLANDVFTFVNGVVIAGGNKATEAAVGLIQEATDAQSVAGTNLNPGTPLAVQPKSLAAVFASNPALGSTAQTTAQVTTLAFTTATGSAGGTWASGGTTIGIGQDASADAINVGTGAAARVITIGNVTVATQLVINAGTAPSSINTTNGVFNLLTGTGAINVGTDANAKTMTLGNSTGATSISLNTGTGSSLNLGTNAIAHIVTTGNITEATLVNIN